MDISSLQKKILFGIGMLTFFATLAFADIRYAKEMPDYAKKEVGFVLACENFATPIVISNNDFEGVKLVAKWFANDIEMVCGSQPKICGQDFRAQKQIILIGTIGNSELLDKLMEKGLIDVAEINGQWERSLTQVVENPFPGVDKALVLAGSDKRGTIYAMLNLSRKFGVSPWYWWADVPVKKKKIIYVNPERIVTKSPAVKYRGIFLNDEEPALGGWVRESFGGFNVKFYSHVFELILRQRGNFLWPAMWGKAFFDDDPKNGILADKLGIVMSTSHHEPMGRAQAEWHRYGSGPWDYTKNKKALSEFWQEGMERNKAYETIVTVGMRGDGDKAMQEGTNIALLEDIVNDQRKIIREVTGREPEGTPQVWALYKEVQDYYDNGMRVPDDVTLLLCDDNWGNVRKLPEIDSPVHKGGYGMYYHVDYVGDPRSYRWVNVSQIQRIWEQMNMTWQHGVDRIWVLNVGDLKPMEFPMSFFLDMAWAPDTFNSENLFEYTVDWCSELFGEEHARDAAKIINLYTKYNHRVTPELLDENTYSLENYDEYKRVQDDYRDLAFDALRLYNFMPNTYKDAFDQLVLFPTNASANLYEMYYAVAKNHKLSAQNNQKANYWADKVEACFKRDSLFTVHYNTQISGGKWNHMMDQTRIGYASWNNPSQNIMPKVIRVKEEQISAENMAFLEADGYVCMEAANYQQCKETETIKWKEIANMGKNKSGITTFPQNVYPDKKDEVYLEYAIDFTSTGNFEVSVLVSPTLNFNANKGLRYAISFDGGTEQIVNLNKAYRGELGPWQANRIIETKTTHNIDRPGVQRLRIRVLEPGIVLQKILIDTGGLKPSYLGPPESKQVKL